MRLPRADRLEFTRRTFLGGTMGAAGLAGITALAHASARATPVELHPVGTVDRTLPVDLRTASHLLEGFVPAGVAGLVSTLGTRVVRDVLVPGSGQQAAAMRAWAEQGVGVVGVVTRTGDGEAHARRRIRAAARHGDALVRLEFASGELPLPANADGLHRRLVDTPMGDAPSGAFEGQCGSAAATLRRWLSDLDHAVRHPDAATPYWPLIGDGGLVDGSPTGLTPTPGFQAISRFNALARSAIRGGEAVPASRLTVCTPPGRRSLGWDLGSGRALVAVWAPPGALDADAVLRVRSSRAMRWRRFAPASTDAVLGTARGVEWAGRTGGEPAVLIADPV